MRPYATGRAAPRNGRQTTLVHRSPFPSRSVNCHDVRKPSKVTGENVASLLHLDSSANRFGEPVTRELTALFADAWRARHGPAGYRYRDLAADPVPPDTACCALGRRVERHGLVPPARHRPGHPRAAAAGPA